MRMFYHNVFVKSTLYRDLVAEVSELHAFEQFSTLIAAVCGCLQGVFTKAAASKKVRHVTVLHHGSVYMYHSAHLEPLVL